MASVSSPIVLIIDDSFDHQELLRLLLEGEGYQVVAALNGQEALDTIAKMASLPSLILLDLMMPVMDGFAFRANQLRMPALAKIPVIIMSASGQTEEQLKDLNASGFLKKPMDIEVLLRMAAKLTRPLMMAEAQKPLHEIENADGAKAQGDE